MIRKFIIAIACLLTLISNPLHAQTADTVNYKTVVAGKEYEKSGFYQAMWGKHYRKEWLTPVNAKIAMIDTLAGGLIPYEVGGRKQTKSLRLRDKDNREWVLRSVDKTFAAALPEITRGSFLETLANDQASIAPPYSALTIAPMAEAIGIYHSNSQLYFIPKQPALGKFSDETGDALYFLEQRADGNWETAANFGNAKDFKSTDKMLDKIHEDNDRSVDQLAFLKIRLFDMIIGDWDRHEDQWKWAEFKDGKKTLYQAIPRDRDQAYTLWDGYLIQAGKRLGRINVLQSFGSTIKDIDAFNFPARNLDKHFLNALSFSQWEETAAAIKKELTDAVIDNALQKLPSEIYNISGPKIASQLKSRRDHLQQYAEKYYKILSKEVDITGSSDQEFFEVKRMGDDSTQVNIYKITNKGKTKDQPFYTRVFYTKETSEIRLYGLGGEDEYEITGNVNKGIRIRLIGGIDRDKFTDASHVKGAGHKTKIYDDSKNEFSKSSETRIHISSDSTIHTFKYHAYTYDKRGFTSFIFYNNEDKLFLAGTYLRTKNMWRKEPYGIQQFLGVSYSLTQNALSADYKSRFTKLAGKWDAVLLANYDFIRWTNFFGLGNETKLVNTDKDFNRMRSSNYLVSLGLERIFRKKHKVSINGFYQGIDIKNDTARYLAKTNYNSSPDFYKTNGFAGANITYLYQKLNDSVLPTSGISFLTNAGYTNNLRNDSKSFGKLTTELDVYFPFTKRIGISVKVAGATLAGTPLFYQYNAIGGSESLRGYRRERFYGTSTAYNQNELQWIAPVHSYMYNGKIGIFGLYDIGRVWLKNETSDKWHCGYGGGIILSPFNLITASVAYAVSSEDKSNIYIQLIKAF